MRCYNHGSAEAVGACKHCGKGVCAVCAKDTDHGLACSDACAGELRQVARLVSYSKHNVTGATGSARTVWAAVAVLIFGIMLYRDFRSPFPDYTRVSITILLTSFSIYYLVSGFRRNDGNS